MYISRTVINYSLDEVSNIVHHNVAALFRYQVSDVVRERLERGQCEASAADERWTTARINNALRRYGCAPS